MAGCIRLFEKHNRTSVKVVEWHKARVFGANDCGLESRRKHIFLKICYDKAGNLPNKGRNFITQTSGKIVYFLFVWLVGIGFRQNFFRVLPNFGDFGAKMSFFHYIINQKRNNFIKHCPPPVYQEAADIRDVYLYKKFAMQVGSWYTGGNDVL